MRAKWSAPIRKYWKISEQMMVKYCDLAICDSVNCALYWSRKPGSLAKLVDKTDQMNADEIAEMGRKAKKRVAEEYTWDKICGQYEDVFVGK